MDEKFLRINCPHRNIPFKERKINSYYAYMFKERTSQLILKRRHIDVMRRPVWVAVKSIRRVSSIEEIQKVYEYLQLRYL